MPEGETPILKEAERMMQHQQLLNLIRSLPVEGRAAFEQWYRENQKVMSPSDWPGLKKYFPNDKK
jgi:hypothetical protein